MIYSVDTNKCDMISLLFFTCLVKSLHYKQHWLIESDINFISYVFSMLYYC